MPSYLREDFFSKTRSRREHLSVCIVICLGALLHKERRPRPRGVVCLTALMFVRQPPHTLKAVASDTPSGLWLEKQNNLHLEARKARALPLP